MNKIILTSDSGIDPTNEQNMIPALIIENGEKTYKDCLEINSSKILKKIKEENVFTTSSPLLGDYYNMFSKILENGDDVIHLCMSSGISEGSFNSAFLTANTLNEEYNNKVYVIDTLNGATGGTLIYNIADGLIKEGYSAKSVIEYLNILKNNILTSFYVPDPKGFIRSGRNKSELCIKDKAILMGLKTALIAGIKFRVDFNEDGNLYTKKIFKSKRKDGMMKLTQDIINEQNKYEYDPKIAVVGTVKERYVLIDDIITYLKDLNYFDKIIRKDINGIVAAYGSEDLCGISLIKKYFN